MIDTKTQFVTDDKGNKVAVILPILKYYQIIEDLENINDNRLYDEAKNDKDEGLPIDEAFEIIEKGRKKNNL